MGACNLKTIVAPPTLRSSASLSTSNGSDSTEPQQPRLGRAMMMSVGWIRLLWVSHCPCQVECRMIKQEFCMSLTFLPGRMRT